MAQSGTLTTATERVALPTTSVGRGRALWQRLRRSKGALVGIVILAVLAIVAVAAPLIAPFDPIKISDNALFSPGSPYFFGSDQYGRDILSRILFGARISLTIGLISVGIAATFGVTIGLLAGYYGGWVDALLMYVINVMLAVPGILLALAIVTIRGKPSLANLMIAVGISGIPTYARLVRGSVLAAKENVYVDAARVSGAPTRIILVRHLLPNVIAPVIVATTLGTGTAILAAASLSFLGLGSQPPSPEWGRMLSEGRGYLRDQWWISTFPGLAIMLTVLAMNLLGDGLRDALDPRLRR
ncbi:MAG: ABC transporter permease [Chloroflexota bacterium]|nr:ABC transporter permease [Chloroflexota bacterium]